MKLVAGANLSKQLREKVLRVFVHRYTGEHKPSWTNRTDCQHCVPTHVTDAQWIDDHAFYVTKNGELAVSRSAEPVYLADA